MTVESSVQLNVPLSRPSMTEAEIAEVEACLRSGWLTTGPRTRRFESYFAECVGADYAVAVNSCTAALHLAAVSLGLKRGQAVLVPTMTFAATAEVVRYCGAVPVLVDCDPVTLNMDLDDAEQKLSELKSGRGPLKRKLRVVGMIPVHVGGLMMDLNALSCFASRHGLWMVEDAAHAIPAAYRDGPNSPWKRCGENSSAVTCFSFYANKTMTTGEGGMAVTSSRRLADRMRQMSLHGLSSNAWGRYGRSGAWDYRILEPGYKYNMTDIAAALGLCQLDRAEDMRRKREALAEVYFRALRDLEQLELPPVSADRIHAWHLFPVRLCLERLAIDRDAFLEELRHREVGCSVHWRPLHLHPYYRKTFGWRPEHLPVATLVWRRLISLPLFSDMGDQEQEYVVDVVRELCARHSLQHDDGELLRRPR